MIYLMQHGEAMEKSENPARPLSNLGRQNVERVASMAGLVKANQIVHSDKLRAIETAEILGRALDLESSVRDGLAAKDPVAPIVEWLSSQDSVVIVGHLPFLDRLLSALVLENEKPGLLHFRNAGLICLKERKIQWVLWPEMFPKF